jgi:hypothetical protein
MFSIHPFNRLVRSPAIDDFTQAVDLRDSDLELCNAIARDQIILTALCRHGFNVYDHVTDDPTFFLMCMYRLLIQVNKKTRRCSKQDILDGMRDLGWLKDFLRYAATEARTTSVALSAMQ